MEVIKLTIHDSELLPRRGSFITIQIDYSTVAQEYVGRANEASHTAQHTMRVNLTDSLLACWNKSGERALTDDELKKVIYEYAWRNIVDAIQNGGTLTEDFEVLLATHNIPTVLEFDPAKIKITDGYASWVEIKRIIGFQPK